MIRIIIGKVERDLSDASENWINQQINCRKADGVPVCVRVIINDRDVYIILSTPTCGVSRGGRPPRPHE